MTPQTSHDATTERLKMRDRLATLRTDAKARSKAHADADHLYRRENAKAILKSSETSDKKRESQAYGMTLDDRSADQGVAIAEAGGLGAFRPKTVGECRWMRDRIKAIADHANAVAYDAKEEFDTFEEELRMVRQERDQAAYGQEVGA